MQLSEARQRVSSSIGVMVATNHLTTYGVDTLKKLTDFYGKEQCDTGVSCPDIVAEQAEAEWKIFRRVMLGVLTTLTSVLV